jgi:threonyl-tRNA synthetase
MRAFLFYVLEFKKNAVMILCVLQIENQEFGLKPMNCPGHCLMFQHRVRSYRGKFIFYEILSTFIIFMFV